MIEEEGSGVDEVAEQEELEYVDEFLMNNVSTLDYELFKKTDQVDSFLRKVGLNHTYKGTVHYRHVSVRLLRRECIIFS